MIAEFKSAATKPIHQRRGGTETGIVPTGPTR